mmetsp:Transcript_707/g.1703  ORF Transcript_707/g.1703 Transcript_707/m.1703 type:complete len:173 (+) Transcript_707:367-885(+)
MYIFGYPANGQGVDTLGSPPKGLFQFGRDFLKKYYPELKTLNPGLPIYVRPCDGVDAKVLARYERGVYEAQDVNGKSAEGTHRTRGARQYYLGFDWHRREAEFQLSRMCRYPKCCQGIGRASSGCECPTLDQVWDKRRSPNTRSRSVAPFERVCRLGSRAKRGRDNCLGQLQ